MALTPDGFQHCIDLHWSLHVPPPAGTELGPFSFARCRYEPDKACRANRERCSYGLLQMLCSGLFRNYTQTSKRWETKAQTVELFAQVAQLVNDRVWHTHLALETLALRLSLCSLSQPQDTISQSELQQCVT